MNRVFVTVNILIFAMALSCIFDPPNPNNNPNPIDTITGWESAGIVSPGDSGQHVDVCHYNEHMFTFNYRGELFKCIYPDFSWSKMSVPDGERVYCFYCDTVNGLLLISTIECGVYEYSITSRSWRCLVPNNSNWYDSTKLYEGDLNVYLYNIICYKNMIYLMTVQRWGGKINAYFAIHIWKSNKDTIWEQSDSGWNLRMTITDFFTIDDHLYATTFEHGLWRYDGVSWEVIPGTTQEDVHDIVDIGGDTKTIPGFRPRSMVKHNNNIYVGNLGGLVHKLLPGNTWEKKYLNYKDYGFNDTIFTVGPVMLLYSYNGYLIKGTYYFNKNDNLWYNMTPYFDKIDTTYSNALPGTVYGMTNIGDTLFAALGNNEGKHSGVYFLDLKKCKWYESISKYF